MASVLLAGAPPIAAQDFKELVDKASKDIDRGACTEAQRGFSQALRMANDAVGVATLTEAIRVSLLLGEAEICVGDFDAAAKRAANVAERIADNRGFRPVVQFVMAEAAKGKGQYSEAETDYAEAVRLANEILPETDPRRARYLAAWADLNRLRGQYDPSQTHIQQATSVLDKISSSDSVERAYALLAASDLARDRERWSDARTQYDQAAAIMKVKAPEHPLLARVWLGRGLVELAAGDAAAAETFLKQAQSASRKLPASTVYLDTEDALGLLNLRRGKLKEAEDDLAASRDNRAKYRGKGHPSTAASLDHLGQLHMAQQRWNEALDPLRSAEQIRRQTLGPEHPELAETLYHLGHVYRVQRKFAEAAGSLSEALKIQKAKLGAESLTVAFTTSEQGSLLADQGKYDEAEPRFREALAIEEKFMPLTGPPRLEALRGLALALHGEGKPAQAEPLLTQWMRSRGDTLPLLDPNRLPVAIALAEIEVHDGKNAAAEKDFGEILAANEKLGKEALKLPLVHKALGDAFFGEKKWKEAARNYEAALPNLGAQPDVARVWENLGTSYAAQSQWAESARSFQKALDLSKKGASDSAAIPRLTLILADVSWDAGHTGPASSYVSEWMSMHAKRPDALSSEEARVLEKSATYFVVAKQYDKAEPLLRLLRAAADKPGSQGINLNHVLIQLADATAAQNKNGEAADLYQRLATRSHAVRQLADSERYLLQSKALREKAARPNDPGLVSILEDLGETYVAEAKYAEARKAFDQARAILQQNGRGDDPLMAVTLNGLGEVFQGEKNPDEAEKLFGQAQELLKKSPNPPPSVMASVLYNIGSLKMSSGNVKEAADYFAKCRNLMQGNYSDENPPPIEQFDQIAGAYERLGQFEEAEKLYRENLDLRRKFFGENSTQAAWGLYYLAVFYNARKQYDQAAQVGEQALHYFEGRSGEESDEVALVLNVLATSYNAKHDVDRALVAMDRSAQIQQKLGRPRDEITPTLSALGESYRRRKQYGKALQIYQKMAELWQAESFNAPNYQRAVLYIAIQYAYLSDIPHSKEWYGKLQKALQQQRNSIQQTKAAESYAEALREAGQEREARRVLDQARSPGR